MLVRGAMILTQCSSVIQKGHKTSFSTFLGDFGDDANATASSKFYRFWTDLPEDALNRLCDCCLPTNLQNDAFVRWKDFNTFRFLELPPEVREKIIILALDWSGSMNIEPFRFASTNPFKKPNLALMRTSKQIYREAASILYLRTTFCFRHSITDLRRFYRALTKASQLSIRSIKVELDHLSLISSFCVLLPVEIRTSSLYWWGFEEFLIKDDSHLELFQHLQDICIKFPHPRYLETLFADE